MSSEERERAKASSDGIHCSISEVVVAVIVEDRLLCFPLHLSLPFTVHRTVYTNHPHPARSPCRSFTPPHSFPRLHPPQCRESSAGPVSSVCQWPRKRAHRPLFKRRVQTLRRESSSLTLERLIYSKQQHATNRNIFPCKYLQSS